MAGLFGSWECHTYKNVMHFTSSSKSSVNYNKFLRRYLNESLNICTCLVARLAISEKQESESLAGYSDVYHGARKCGTPKQFMHSRKLSPKYRVG